LLVSVPWTLVPERKAAVQFTDNYFYYIIGIGVVVMVALIGLLLFMRNQGDD
jgi:hypothetical protein